MLVSAILGAPLALAACGDDKAETTTEFVVPVEPTGEEALIEEPTQEDRMMADSMADEPQDEMAESAASLPRSAKASTDNAAATSAQTPADDGAAAPAPARRGRPAGSPYRPLPSDPNVERARRERGGEKPAENSGPPPEIR